MPLIRIFSGQRFTITAWADSPEVCQYHEFMRGLEATNNSDAASLVRLLEKTSDEGPPSNPTKFRRLKGKGKGLWEFKARNGSRILAFHDSNRSSIIVCTHGIPKLKPKKFDREIEKALEIKEKYKAEIDGDES